MLPQRCINTSLAPCWLYLVGGPHASFRSSMPCHPGHQRFMHPSREPHRHPVQSHARGKNVEAGIEWRQAPS